MEHRLAALDEVLNDQGRTIEGVLRKCFEETYASLVPEEKREEIETLIRQEEAQAQQEAEAARRFAVIHFHEDGDDFHFTSDLRNNFYSAAYLYRNYMRENEGRLTLDSLALILSRLVDTFFSRISLTMPLAPKSHNTAYVLPQEEPLHW